MISKKVYSNLKDYSEASDEAIELSHDFYRKILKLTGDIIRNNNIKDKIDNTENLSDTDKLFVNYIEKIVDTLGDFKIPQKTVEARDKQIKFLVSLKDELE